MPETVPLRPFLSRWPSLLPASWLEEPPWSVLESLADRLAALLAAPGDGWTLEGSLLRHRTARIADPVSVQGPVIAGPGASVGAFVTLRGGVFLDADVRIGPSCELKSCLVLAGSAVAHLGYVGNSLVGSDVNLEAGVVLANHFNERPGRTVPVLWEGRILDTRAPKFGALVGDRSRLGANAVTTPGSLLQPGAIVGRLELVDQVGAFLARSGAAGPES